MNKATKELTLADFQQQVATRYFINSWDDFINSDTVVIPFKKKLENEAIELYAAYRFEQGKQEGEAKGYSSGYSKGLERAEFIDNEMLEAELKSSETKGWNEAIQWAANTVGSNSYLYTREAHSQSILNGLKNEEE